jgi:hypothetical protein
MVLSNTLHIFMQVAAAHSCYLAAELNIESYSESSRMCLIGADHLRCPRTFTSPEAIQVFYTCAIYSMFVLSVMIIFSYMLHWTYISQMNGRILLWDTHYAISSNNISDMNHYVSNVDGFAFLQRSMRITYVFRCVKF